MVAVLPASFGCDSRPAYKKRDTKKNCDQVWVMANGQNINAFCTEFVLQ
jgi:hypothetical protein